MISNFIEGPFWYFSLVVFFLGLIWKLVAILLGRKPVDLSVPKGSAGVGALRTVLSRFLPDSGMFPHIRLQVFAGYLFHLGLFALIFFAAPHVRFLDENFLGFSWSVLPHWGFIVAAQFAFLGLIMLWLHRLINPVTKLISSAGDYIATILTFVVMVTGCFALAESFDDIRLLHRFFVELFLIYFPFSQLMHAFTFIPSRAFTGAWFGRRGIRS